MELNAVIHDLIHDLAAPGLHARHRLHIVLASVVHPGRVIHRRANGIDLGLVHRHALANGPQVEKVTTKRLALLGVGVGHVDRSLRSTNTHTHKHHALVLEVLHRLVKPAMHGAEHLLVGDPDVVKDQLGRVGTAPPVLVELVGDREALRASGHEEHRDAVLVLEIGSGGDDRQIAVDRVGDVHLAAVDPPAVSILHRRGPYAGHVRTGVGLGDTDREDGLTGEHFRHPLGQLLVIARVDEVRAGHVGVHEHGDVEAGEGRGPECLGEGG